jgi:hypothetical protein
MELRQKFFFAENFIVHFLSEFGQYLFKKNTYRGVHIILEKRKYYYYYYVGFFLIFRFFFVYSIMLLFLFTNFLYRYSFLHIIPFSEEKILRRFRNA